MEAYIRRIVEALERKFPQGPPTDAVVRSQAFDFLTNQWIGRWPAHLPVPTVLQNIERRRVSRSDLFVQARSVNSAESILNLYVEICGWGTGTKAQRVARCVKPLHEDGAVAALTRAFNAAKSENPVEAYRRLNTRGEDRIKYFGPAFFTKWLYFSSYDTGQDRHDQLPLILDARVANAIGWKNTGWRSGDYGRYLEIVRQISEVWHTPTQPHVVEYALFKLGASPP